MGRPPAVRIDAGDTVRFTALAALFAIFLDMAVGHGLLWENDPYWTYWVTKTFLLATVIGLGTAWAGIGAGRGAVIMAVHGLVLTVYYWTFSPIGLPSHPEWLDLEHTWITGVPIHFTVLYAGYLAALWLWRRRARSVARQIDDPASLGRRALVVGTIIVVIAGGIASAALQDFPGITWFIVRLLLTVPLLMFWWTWAGRDAVAAVAGALFLALVWAAYGHYLGPSGLPATDLRLLDATPPPSPVRWLDYRELWLISFPLYFISIAAVLLTESRVATRSTSMRPSPAALFGVVLFGTALTISPAGQGVDARIEASGEVLFETGEFFGNAFEPAQGEITIRATNMGSGSGMRVTPLPPHDRIVVRARIEHDGRTYEVFANRPMVEDPLGRFGTWWGVGYHVEHHGRTGIGSPQLPAMKNEFAAFALGEVRVGDRRLVGVPVHVMTAERGLPSGATLELEVGDPDVGPIDGLPDGHLRVLWASWQGEVPEEPKWARYAGGGAFLLLLTVALLILNRRETTGTA